MGNIKISVVLPIFKVEDYLGKCIDSIVNQSLKNIEILLATDGPESCNRICEDYAQKDSRIKIIYNPGSYGKAVNMGIDAAQGEYIGIIETDDWIKSDMFEKLYKKAISCSADIVKCGWHNSYDKKINGKKFIFAQEQDVFNIKDEPTLLGFQASVWSAIYKKEFLNKNNIRFIQQRGLSYIDSPFHVETLLKAETVATVKEALYFYYQDNPSQSIKSGDKVEDAIIAEQYLYNKLADNKELFDKYKEALLWATAYRLQSNYFRISKDKRQKFWDKARELLLPLDLSNLNYTYFNTFLKIFLNSLLKHSDCKFYEEDEQKNTKINLLSAIPLLQIQQNNFNTYFQLLNFIPLMIIRYYPHKTKFCLFNFITILKIRFDFDTAKYYLLNFIPLFSIKRA